ncbi:MAG: ABC transporter substrate-binding protein [Clostridiales bacterium]|jgi:peptide/nickel transport system substrate-binding protein|nr:ABC transporter substrate-binding protein [Clostridiales bacterium]
MKKKFILLILIFFFVSCSQKEEIIENENILIEIEEPHQEPTPQPDERILPNVLIHPALAAVLEDFPAYTTNDSPLLPRGSSGTENILRVGVGTSSTFPGLFLKTHSEDSFDSSFGGLANDSIVSFDAGNIITNNGIATFRYDREENVVVLEMQEEVFWHDGTPLTLDDLVFAYEVVAHPEYTGVRFDAANFIPNVKGIAEYRAGETDSISGMVLSNENRMLHIYYENPLPPSALFIGGIWLDPIPRHWISFAIEQYGHANLHRHPRARSQLLGFGAFIIETVVPGESVYFIANDNYWQGAPLVDGILVELLSFDMIPAAMRAGDYDIAAYQAANLAEHNLMNPTNYQLYGWPSASTTFLNFRLGGMGENGVYLRDDEHPITNVAIRRALAHAVDRQIVADVIGQGLHVLATSVLHPFNAGNFIDFSRQGFYFDLQLANQILDDAGFTERDEEGFRLDLNGEPMTFIYGQHSNPTHDVLVRVNIQNWGEIGLRVDMYEGDFIDWNLFSDIVTGTDIGPIDIFAMGWSLGANPAPHVLWSRTAAYNMPRYTSPAFESILNDIDSENAWDPAFLADAYTRWERAFFEEVPAIPFTWNLDLVAVNNRVANYSRVRIDSGLNQPGNMSQSTWGSHLIGLTAPAPYTNSD